ncbi:MAG: site-specific integrase, partial [Deltaproteobacteria bacterium TMED126]|nr:site-specific integrase [Deltaproteobacteria bacterium TMED126]
TGMRKFEILTLKWINIDLKNRIITLDYKNTKNKRKRKIPINSVVKNLLYSLKFKERFSEYVFLNSNNEPYKRQDSLNNVWRVALRNAEISALRFHDLRHTAATRMVERCGNIVAVSKILGHANISTTMRYSHPDKSLEDALESLVDEKVLAILLATGKEGNMQEHKSP